jgi:hypothetical protein
MNFALAGPMNNWGILNQFVPEQEQGLRRLYRDIYDYDAVCGSIVDMLSVFPFSDYSLTGLDADKIEKYEESLQRLNIRALMPEISLARLVDGEFVGSLIFNEKEKVFIDVILYPSEDCRIEELPLYSMDPKIVVRNNEKLRRILTSNDKMAVAIRSRLPASLKQALQAPAFELDPITTLYVSRRTLPGRPPTSFLKRVLPIYLIEKTLFRGTLTEATRRQRSMLHVTMGDDTHEFTPQEMAETVNQFQMADADPLGAVIGTRANVQATELRQGGDFWKWTDTIDTLTPYKLRALGVSEAFLSADATYSNVESGVSVFMENIDAYRQQMTYEVFTNKIFPIIGIANDFWKKGKEVSSDSRNKILYQMSNAKDLEIPTVRWHKRLEAKSDDNQIDLLNTLSEKGFPVPLRMWAAAAKVDLNTLYHDLAEDESIRKKLAQLTGKKPEDFLPKDANDEGGDEGGGQFASLRAPRRKPLLARDFGESGEIKGQTKSGKDKYILNQKKAQQEINQTIAQATAALQDPNVKRAALRRVVGQLGRIPDIIGGLNRDQQQAMRNGYRSI